MQAPSNPIEPQSNAYSTRNEISSQPIPPPPKLSQRATHINPLQKPPPPPPVSSQQKERLIESSVDEPVTHESEFERDDTPTLGDETTAAPHSPSDHLSTSIDERTTGSAQSTNSFLFSAPPRSTSRKADIGSDVLFLVPPKDELDRISLKTALSGRPKREQAFTNLIQLRQHLAIEQILASQQTLQEQMIAITELLRELLVQQQSHDSLVLHVPRQITAIAPRRIRRRVEKVRRVPRKTILSLLEELDRDLSDGEFDTLIQGLHEPSEVEEIYHEYEYDEEYPWHDDVSQTSHVTPNAEEVNAFLRESSESEAWHSAAEVGNAYDSDVYYDGEYYDMEPLEDELLAAWSASDAAAASDELSDEGEASLIDEKEEESVTDIEATAPVIGNADADRDGGDVEEFMDALSPPEAVRRHERESQHSKARSNSAIYRPHAQQPPPPPRRKNQGQSGLRRAATPTPPRVSTRRANGLRQQPPPPPPPVRVNVSAMHHIDELESYDESDDLNEDELQLLEETAINTEGLAMMRGDDDNVDDYDDAVDEEDLRILQLSRWIPSGRKNRRTMDSSDDDIFLDDDVFLDDATNDDAATEDFTDIDFEETIQSTTATVLDDIIEESSEEEMLLGDSAVSDTVPQDISSESGQRLPPPPPPRPPPRPPIVHGASSVFTGTQPQLPALHDPYIAGPQFTGAPQHPIQEQIHQPPPVPPGIYASNTASAGYEIQRNDRYQQRNQQ